MHKQIQAAVEIEILSKALQELADKNADIFAEEILNILDYKKQTITNGDQYVSFCSAYVNNEDFIREKFEVFEKSDKYIDLPDGLVLSDTIKQKYLSEIKSKAAIIAFGLIYPSI